MQGGVILLITLAAYLPVMGAGYVWDDDHHVNLFPSLQSVEGLKWIWTHPASMPQYYPLVYTTFWIERHFWQWQPFGYHLVNVMLHGSGAVLFWYLLSYLSVPGAWLAAAIFALHPVHVESVAWLSERKNVLSSLFYWSSLLAYLRFSNPDPARSVGRRPHQPTAWRFYLLAFFFFICALLSKTTTCSLPIAVLILAWWKQARLAWRDFVPVVPFFLVGAAMGFVTIAFEKHSVGAQGAEWALSFTERGLIAGRALWFYCGKLLYPHHLTFIYPRWEVAANVWWQWVFPLAVVVLVAGLWLLRKRLGKGPLAAVLFFIVTLVPALGFIDFYPMRYSFVADHFQYLASGGLIALFCAVVTLRLRPCKNRFKYVGLASSVGVLSVLGLLTWQQTHIYQDRETLWRDTIRKNPSCWMAYVNLGSMLIAKGNPEEAVEHYATALRLNPNALEDHINLGKILIGRRHSDQSVEVLPMTPPMDHTNNVDSSSSSAGRESAKGKSDEAIAEFNDVLRSQPDNAKVHNMLGVLLCRQQRRPAGIKHFIGALRVNPNYTEAHYNLVLALRKEQIKRQDLQLRKGATPSTDLQDFNPRRP